MQEFEKWFCSLADNEMHKYLDEWMADEETVLDIKDWTYHYKFRGGGNQQANAFTDNIESLLGFFHSNPRKVAEFSPSGGWQEFPTSTQIRAHSFKNPEPYNTPNDAHTIWSDEISSERFSPLNTPNGMRQAIHLYRMYSGDIDAYLEEFDLSVEEEKLARQSWSEFAKMSEEELASLMTHCIMLLDCRQ